MKTEKQLKTEHGIVCSMPKDRFGYFGWPSVARMGDGALVVGASGLRTEHICPWGKTVLFTSQDEGHTWSLPRILNDTPLDDRDCGIVSLGGRKLLVSWFTSNTQEYDTFGRRLKKSDFAQWKTVFSGLSEEVVQKWLGSWVRLSQDGEAWADFIRVPVSTPHGPICLSNGDLLYFGRNKSNILAAGSTDEGNTWTELGSVPLCDGADIRNFHEPHVVELSSGKLIGLIRYQYGDNPNTAYIDFSLFKTESEDNGLTWTPAIPTGVYGSPPHVIRHSSGALVCVYGYRKEPYGQRAMISRDSGATWDADWILRDDGPSGDLGYPCSTELPDGRIFTVYYQQTDSTVKCSLLWTCWKLPEWS
ncbi:sialidase family protein [Verrucomicrobiota bacterium]